MKKKSVFAVLVSAFTLISVVILLRAYYSSGPPTNQSIEKPITTKNATQHKDKRITATAQPVESLELSKLEQEISALKSQINSLAVNVKQSNIDPDHKENDEAKKEGVPQEETNLSKDEEYAIEYENNFNFLSAKLLSEAVDQQWADDTVSSIETAIESNTELEGIEVVQTTCMSTMCKLEINIGPSQSVEEAMQRLSLNRPWQGQTTFVINRDGYAQFIFAREGYTLSEAGSP